MLVYSFSFNVFLLTVCFWCVFAVLGTNVCWFAYFDMTHCFFVRSTHSTLYHMETWKIEAPAADQDALTMNSRHRVELSVMTNCHCLWLLQLAPKMRSVLLVCLYRLKLTRYRTLPTLCVTEVSGLLFRCRLITTASSFRLRLIFFCQ